MTKYDELSIVPQQQSQFNVFISCTKIILKYPVEVRIQKIIGNIKKTHTNKPNDLGTQSSYHTEKYYNS